MSRYKKIGLLGEGSYGKVYSAIDRDTKKNVSIKRVFLRKKKKQTGIVGLCEIDICSKIIHPYINSIINVVEDPFDERLSPIKNNKDDIFYLVFPYLQGCFSDLVRNKSIIIPPREKLRIMYQCLSGLYALHAHNIAHRDLKPSNILYDKYGEKYYIKITDFGLSKPMNLMDENSTFVINRYYKPPEIILGNRNYDCKIDIWSMACIFHEMFNKTDLFKGKNESTILNNIFKAFGTPSLKEFKIISNNKNFRNNFPHHKGRDISKVFKLKPLDAKWLGETGIKNFYDLIQGMLRMNPNERLTAWECLSHPFFSSINFKANDLIRQLKITFKYHKLQKVDSVGRFKGIKIIKKLFHYDEENKYSILFQALDLYDRCLIEMEKDAKKKDEDFPLFSFDHVAYICSYISIKYFMGETSISMSKLYPSLKPKQIKILAQIEVYMVKKYLKNIIYRPTVYDLIKKKPKDKEYEQILFELLTYGEKLYNTLRIDVIAERFVRKVDKN